MPKSFAKPKPVLSTFILGLIGALLHFLYGWLGEWAPIGAIAAVNESVWEHTKLAFIPLFLYWLILAVKLRGTHRWTHAVTAGLASTGAAIFLIPALFYIFLYGFSIESLFLDIAIFFFSLLFAQIAGAYIFRKGSSNPLLTILSILLMLGLLAFYLYASYYPPDFPIFIPA